MLEYVLTGVAIGVLAMAGMQRIDQMWQRPSDEERKSKIQEKMIGRRK